MATSARRRIRHLVGASCAAALLAGTVGVASAEAAPRTTKATAESSSAAPLETCTDYHYDENGMLIWDPPGCTPP
ncbi:hypothetical protein [Streptomyces himalayensis]|uniref:Uncharacterized protein n=1 Tax=Streptomyces himalayensis subsp. himalayensis TaxID=2756131 RepID=A0A7W0DKG8_9ACTN|nr:hypothetical protein [Streptomyces himalayensis]MBA2946395.1 hypothetical protein [Streptomyces himalayensis subsp. himalayensis]